MLDIAFIQQCAPDVPPITANAIIKTESSFNPWAIGVNSASRLARQPTSYQQAAMIAADLIKSGASFDLGLAQINSNNLAALGLSTNQVLDPCTNLKAMQNIFVDCFNRAKLREKNSEKAVKMAFSCYNTGNFKDGFSNGYVVKVLKNHNFGKNSDPKLYVTGNAIRNQQSVIKQKERIAQYVNSNQQNINNKNISLSADKDMGMTKIDSDFQVSSQNINTPLNINDQIENNLKSDIPIKVHHSWDIFKDF